MAAATLDLIIDKGSTYKKTFTYQTANRTPIDLTGYTARMQARKSYNSTNAIIDLTTENGGISIIALEGKISLYISSIETSAIGEASGVYDLELIAPNGDISKFIRGTVRFPEEVTKWL